MSSERKRQLSNQYTNSPSKHVIQTMDNGEQGVFPVGGAVQYSHPPPSQQHLTHQVTQQQQHIPQQIIHGLVPQSTHPPTLAFTTSTNGCGISEIEIELIAQRVMTCMQTQMKKMETKILKGVQKQMSVLQEENQSLRNENHCLKLQIDELEQYSRRNAVRITGIPEQVDENTDEIVIKLAKDINVDLEPRDIGRSHRVGDPKKSKKRPIICKFPTYNIRNKLYMARKELKNIPDRAGVYINEDLTAYRSNVLYQARQQVKAGHITSCFSSDGRLFVKKTPLSNAIQIHGTASLSDIVGLDIPHIEPGNMARFQSRNVSFNVKPKTSQHQNSGTVRGIGAIMEVTEDADADSDSNDEM